MAKHKASNSSNAQSAMAKLLAAHQNKFVTLKKGESVKATLTKLSTSEILVDAGAKTEALVLERDKRIVQTILSTFKVGETVEVSVLNPESESGQPIVSLRRYLGNMAWEKLEELQKKSEQVEVTIKDVTKAGFLADTAFGVSGFLPQSHTTFTADGLKPGQRVSVTVLEINRKDNKVIFSQKKTMSAEEFTKLSKQFTVGNKVNVTVTNVTPFGVFVALPLPKADGDTTDLEGFIHISETSWEKVEDITGTYTPGQALEAVLTKFDTETRRVSLSIKRLTADPFEELMEQYPVDKKVSGTVVRIEDGDVVLTLNGDEAVEGVIKKDKIAMGTTYTVGQTVNLTISDYDKRKHRILVAPILLEKPMGYR
jgi:small subunit ribosomal protein S1